MSVGTIIGIGGLGVLFVGLYGSSRLLAAWLRRIDAAVGRIDPSPQRSKQLAVWSRVVLMGVGIVLGTVLFVVYSPLTPVLEAVVTDATWFVWPLGQGLGLGVVALAVVAVVKRGFGSTVAELLEQRHTVPAHYRKRLWAVHAILLVGVPMLVAGLVSIPVSVGTGDDGDRPEDGEDGVGAGTDADSSEEPRPASESTSGLERTLAAMEPETFADAVTMLRREWGRECTIGEAGAQPWIDVFARADDGTRELLRTVHRQGDEPVTRRAFTDSSGSIEYAADADSVLIVTNGRFDERAR